MSEKPGKYGSLIRKARGDSIAESILPEIEVAPTTMPLDQIGDRASADTRPLNQVHVEALAESIAAVGLLQPIVIDSQGRLLAGGHRKAALLWLRETAPEIFDKWFPNGIPVYRLNFDAELQPDSAFEVEIIENERRLDYSRDEIRSLADRLRKAGYVDTPGRPKKGEKRLRPALEIIVGKSLPTLRRYLNESDEPQKTRSDERVLRNKHLKTALRALEKWDKVQPETNEEQALAEKLPEVLTAISAVLNSQ